MNNPDTKATFATSHRTNK